jgi:hypothetical protein
MDGGSTSAYFRDLCCSMRAICYNKGGKYQSCTNANAASSFGKLQSVGQTEGMKSCKHELDKVAGGTPFEEELQSCSPALPRGTRPAKTPYYHNDRG